MKKLLPSRTAQPATPSLLSCTVLDHDPLTGFGGYKQPLQLRPIDIFASPHYSASPLQYFRNFVHKVIQILCWLQIVFLPKCTRKKALGCGI